MTEQPLPGFHLVRHPLADLKVTALRDKATPPAEFRRRLQELSQLVAYEALRDFEVVPQPVETPLARTSGVRAARPLVLMPVLRAVETVWRNSLKGFYSVTVNIAGTDLAVNGKGVSHEYALASANGEMMERLQNFCTFRLSFDVSPEALVHKGFYYAPDEWLGNMDLWVGCIHPDDRPAVLAELARCREHGRPFRSEYRARTRDGACCRDRTLRRPWA